MTEIKKEIQELADSFGKLKEERLLAVSKFKKRFNFSFFSCIAFFLLSIYFLLAHQDYLILNFSLSTVCIIFIQQSIWSHSHLSMHKENLFTITQLHESITKRIAKQTDNE